MAAQEPFSEVLRLFEEHGWTLARMWEEYRIFEKPGTDELPYPVPVHDRKVEKEDVDKIKAYLSKKG